MRFLDGLVLFGFLATAFQWRAVLPIDIRLGHAVVIGVLLMTVSMKGVRINRQIGVFCILAAATSMIGVLASGTTVPVAVAQLVGIGIYSSALFSYFGARRISLVRAIDWYLKLMVVLAAFALVQQGAYLLGIRPLYEINYLLPGVGVGETTREGLFLRVFSLFTEPGHFAIALTPAVYVAVNVLGFGRHYFYTRGQALTVLAAVLFTFSSVGYVGLLLCLLFAAGRRRAIRAVILLGATGVAAYLLVGGFRDRLLTLSQLAFQGDAMEGNVSALNFYVNARVALGSLISHPLWGSGLGSHSLSYQAFITKTGLGEGVVSYLGFVDPAAQNREDAYSLLLRIPSELGLLGILGAAYFFASNRVRVPLEPYRMLSRMCVVFFLTYAAREGHYFRFELWYFLAFYAHLEREALRAISQLPTMAVSSPRVGAGVSM